MSTHRAPSCDECGIPIIEDGCPHADLCAACMRYCQICDAEIEADLYDELIGG